ncbi:MAG: hypothetical protein ACE5EG_12205 [Thermoanaerobaculia bacterium]
MRRAHVILVVCCVLATACAPPPPEEPVELETVDVAPPLDAELSTEGDLKAVQRAAAIAGVVPSDLPPDLPLFVPSSVIDFGGPAGGRSFVELDASEPPAVLRRWLGERLPAAGWTVGAIGDDLVQAHKGERRVDYRLTDLAPGTRIRLEYEPRP